MTITIKRLVENAAREMGQPVIPLRPNINMDVVAFDVGGKMVAFSGLECMSADLPRLVSEKVRALHG